MLGIFQSTASRFVVTALTGLGVLTSRFVKATE